MIDNFVEVKLLDENVGSIEISQQTKKSFVLHYPCSSDITCTPYVLTLQKGSYKFECWGSAGGDWNGQSTPGLGGYTSGILSLKKPNTFYVFIGKTGFYNAVKFFDKLVVDTLPGGATDVRLNISEN